MTPRERLILELEPIAVKYDLTFKEVLVRSRARRLVNARREMAHYLHEKGRSLTEIGRFFARDHTTILYLLKTPQKPLKKRLNKKQDQITKVRLAA